MNTSSLGIFGRDLAYVWFAHLATVRANQRSKADWVALHVKERDESGPADRRIKADVFVRFNYFHALQLVQMVQAQAGAHSFRLSESRYTTATTGTSLRLLHAS